MSQYYFAKGGTFSWSDAEPMGVIDLPAAARTVAQYEGRTWVLLDYERPWWAFWRKRGLHWFEVKLPPVSP